jgi:UDPglucose--hexose-1-phosphate uridylyltransferase
MTQRHGNHEPSTSELRHDWLTDRWVIIAPQRTERPDDFAGSAPVSTSIADSHDSCPFCRGHENETPPPLAVYPARPSADSGSSWLVRVVPNKFPAVNGVDSLRFVNVAGVSGIPVLTASPGSTAANHNQAHKPSIDLFQARQVNGAHEVIIESPLHLCSLTQLDRQTANLTFLAYRDRLLHWSNCIDIAYAVVFKNVGQDAGASLVHTHSQLIATNVLPTDVRRAVERMQLFQQTEQTCLFCRMLEDELSEKVRVVAETEEFVAFCPFASRLPSLLTVMPRHHASSFETSSDESVEQLAWLVHRLLRSIEVCYPQAAYNYVLHTAPQGLRNSNAFHWRLEIFPRLTRMAGFEWGSDCFINPLPPETAAQRLRNQRLDNL